jgi:hypothetical protein
MYELLIYNTVVIHVLAFNIYRIYTRKKSEQAKRPATAIKAHSDSMYDVYKSN